MASKHTTSQRKYDSANCTFYYLKFNNRTDADVIAKLASVPSKQNYIRQLIRKDLAADPETTPTDTKED